MPVVRTGGQAGGWSVYGHVITKFSRMGSLPHFVTHGAPLCARFARARSSAINKGNGFVAACTVVKLLACTQTSFSCSFRQQSRIQERARRASAELEEEKEKTSVLWTSLGEKRFLLSPSHGNFVSFCCLLSPPLPPCATCPRRSLEEKIEGLWTGY